MEKPAFGSKVNKRSSRMDRFVAPRASIPDISKRFWRSKSPVHEWDVTYLYKKTYANRLNEAFGLPPSKPKQTTTNNLELLEIQKKKYTWPCKPRSKTFLVPSEIVLDLPTYNCFQFPHLIDWSAKNIIGAALIKTYHQWSYLEQGRIEKGSSEEMIQCCKYDPEGDLLLIGTAMKAVEIHNTALCKHIDINFCQCSEPCAVSAVDWSATGNSFVIGCTHGAICSITRDSKIINWVQLLKKSILVTKVSPNARYVAVAGFNQKAVQLLTWPDLQLLQTMESGWRVKAMCWHPMCSSLLGIGADYKDSFATVGLWDEAKQKDYKVNLKNNEFRLDTMLFSAITGELVLGLWDPEIDETSDSKPGSLLVLRDMDTMVDHWGLSRNGIDRVKTMVFSTGGCQLATATTNNDLLLWNFLPEDKKKVKEDFNMSGIPMYLDHTSFGFSLR